MPTPLTLTDTQLVLLSAASQREDGLLIQPARLKGGAAGAVADRLLTAGLVEEVAVGLGGPHWREEASGTRIGLKITPAGLRALGISGDDGDSSSHSDDEPEPGVVLGEDPSRARLAAQSIRQGSKRVLVLSLLEREQGATLADLAKATGWLPHTTRAALTGLRQRGYDITRSKDEAGTTVYHVAQPSASTEADAAERAE